MENTTNWYLYTTSKHERKTNHIRESEKVTREIKNKIRLIKKAFK